MFSSLGSLRLPLPPAGRPRRRRRRGRRSAPSRLAGVEPPQLGRLARHRRPNRPTVDAAPRRRVRRRPEQSSSSLFRSTAPEPTRRRPSLPGRDRPTRRPRLRQRPERRRRRRLRRDPATTRFISTDGHAAYVVVQLNVTDEQSVDVGRPASGPRSSRRPATPSSSRATRRSRRTPADQSEKDLQRAETVSLPFAALILHPRVRLARRRRACRSWSPGWRSRRRLGLRLSSSPSAPR